jgi:uncharacterized paraquat-inducible protein A
MVRISNFRREMMAQKGKCPECGEKVKAPDDFKDGLKVICPNCKTTLTATQNFKVKVKHSRSSSNSGDNAFSDLNRSFPFNVF